MSHFVRFIAHSLMTLRPRFFRVLPLVALAAMPLVGSAACAGAATVLSSDADGGAACTAAQDCNDDPTISSTRGQCVGGRCVCNTGVQTTANGKCGNIIGDGGTNDCVAKGGVCVNGEPKPPDGRRQAGPGEGTCGGPQETCWVPISTGTCTSESGCNEDPKISAQLGTCTLGICVCRKDAYVQPSGKCGPTAPPVCVPQGGACRQSPAKCIAGELEGDPSTDKSCGDLVAAACCFKEAACKAPVDFICCSKNNPSPTPICTNGWKTCLPDQTPTALPGTCN